MIKMRTFWDVPKMAGGAMYSQKSEQQISLEDIFTMIFQMFVCDKQFRVIEHAIGNPISGQRFEVVITVSQNDLHNKVICLEVEKWQMNRIMTAVDVFKRHEGLGHRVRILMLLRHSEKVGWMELSGDLRLNLEELVKRLS
ncbi:MAG: hypothetical protein Q8L24_01815 [bacterium]|nr:hypothetical protein [bacterium]